MQRIANQSADAFSDLMRVTKSHILATNAPTWISVLVGQSITVIRNDLRHVGSIDITNHQNHKDHNKHDSPLIPNIKIIEKKEEKIIKMARLRRRVIMNSHRRN